MNRMFKRRMARYRGFRPGKIPIQNTHLKDVIVCEGKVYQVKTRDSTGQIVELHQRTRFRNGLIIARFLLFKFKNAMGFYDTK
jgi:hypothetical protein